MSASERERSAVLDEAKAIVRGERSAAYGAVEECFDRIAQMWTIYASDVINDRDGVFEPFDVANMMVLLKVARNARGGHRDNWVDIAGYAACGSAAEFGGGRHGE